MSIISIEKIRESSQQILVTGNQLRIIQSILDFDFASGKEQPSVVAIVSGGRKTQKFFWGDAEVLIPVFSTLDEVKKAYFKPDFLFNCTSASSTFLMVDTFFALFPDAHGAHIFAEGVAERDALLLIEKYGSEKIIAGPSGVGLCIPGHLKLGAIGGVLGERVAELGARKGSTAVVCSSGGMVNELMYQVVSQGGGISFGVAFGGDRFPITSPLELLLLAQNDPQTKEIVYFGELGGRDEYAFVEAIKAGKITKPVYAYIAGRFESKDKKIQFGHAKALAKEVDETAVAKTKALQDTGVRAFDTYEAFMDSFSSLSRETETIERARDWKKRTVSRGTLFSSPKYIHTASSGSFTEAILMRLLQKKAISPDTVVFADAIFQELLDHGPHVSGAVNTMITTRAGKDITASLASGLLTIGDRFGGAINNAAKVWVDAVTRGTSASAFVAEYSKNRDYIPGIGHKKYNIHKPDPRVAALLKLGTSALSVSKHTDFAFAVARETAKKKENLILNVDGVIAALFLDYLLEKEMFHVTQIQELIEIGFFNALFVIPRSIGFVGHHFDQKRLDEGLFRLGDGDVYEF